MKSTVICAICYILLPTNVMAQEKQQLYRMTEATRPYKGYLLPVQKGMPMPTNFQTCAGQKLLIDIGELAKETGSCADPDGTGTLIVDDKSILGAIVYMASDKPADADLPLGTILEVKAGEKGKVSNIVISPGANSGINNKAIVVDESRLDFQPQPDGSYYIRVLKNQEDLKASYQK